jgi:hypothetical protein
VTQEQHPVDRAVELFVYAPIGMAMFAKDTVPTFLKMFVARGETEIEHRRKTLGDQLTQYRTVGQLAVKYGGPEVRRRAESTVDQVRRMGGDTVTGLMGGVMPDAGGTAPVDEEAVAEIDIEIELTEVEEIVDEAPAPAVSPWDTHVTETARPWAPIGGAVHDAPVRQERTALAIPDYDQLSASQVVEHLDGLTPDELAQVRDYERAHRGRNTILGKIATLTA